MSQKTHKYAVFNGRFMPWHKGHQAIALKGLDIAEKLIIVLGSDNRPRTIENPWNSIERELYIRKSLEEAIPGVQPRLAFVRVPDRLYNNNLWLANVNTAVNCVLFADGEKPDTVKTKQKKVVMIGHYKDSGSWWLDKFPQWDLKDLGGVNNMNATDIRREYFKPDPNFAYVKALVPNAVYEYLSGEFCYVDDTDAYTPHYLNLVGEMQHVIEYKKPYEHLKYGVKHVTADAVVFCAGHVLLIRRRAFPGKGLWALPGGHIEMDEDVNEYAAIRELIEETKLKVPMPVLEGSLRGEKAFGHPRRSLIGRVITHSYMFELNLPADGQFPKVKGSDDAEKARWFPIEEVLECELFDDHAQIIDYWKGRLTKPY